MRLQNIIRTMRQLWPKLMAGLTRLGSLRTALALITVEPAMLAFFMAIFFLYSAFQPLVYARYLSKKSIKIKVIISLHLPY